MSEAIHNNDKIKIEVRYVGNPDRFEHQYPSTTAVLTIKRDAMDKFKVDAAAEKYALQNEQTVLNDAFTLEQVDFRPEHHRYELDLVASENTDTDGINQNA